MGRPTLIGRSLREDARLLSLNKADLIAFFRVVYLVALGAAVHKAACMISAETCITAFVAGGAAYLASFKLHTLTAPPKRPPIRTLSGPPCQTAESENPCFACRGTGKTRCGICKGIGTKLNLPVS